jgi:hypothetical protein
VLFFFFALRSRPWFIPNFAFLGTEVRCAFLPDLLGACGGDDVSVGVNTSNF